MEGESRKRKAPFEHQEAPQAQYILDAVGSSRILIGKQKIGLTFNSDKLGGNDFTKGHPY